MKIRTITCHDVYNYGASLQAYALQTYLKLQGHDVAIIDYIPHYLKRRKPFWYINPASAYYKKLRKNLILRFGYCLNNYISCQKKAKRRKAFERYTKEFLSLTRRYTDIEQLRKNPPNADLYIAGSDQIWNSYMNNGRDDAFYMDFGSSTVKRCSYAASFGVSSINDEYKEYTRNQIAKLDKIAVRETSGVDILHDLGFNDVTHVLDPVFLLSPDEWKMVASKSTVRIDRSYVIIYAIAGPSLQFKEFALYLKTKFNLAIVAIQGAYVPFADYNLSAAGPCEFISLIASAQYVLSDSFHASAFSSIFNRPFFVFTKPAIKHSARMIDFTNMLDIPWAYMPQNDNIENCKWDWNHVNKRLAENIENSKKYLQDCINLCITN